MTTDGAFYSEYRPTLADRLGFKFKYDESLYEWRFQEPPDEGFIDGTMSSEIHIKLDWIDRLRILFSGHCAVKIYTKTDVEVRQAKSRSQFAVLWG